MPMSLPDQLLPEVRIVWLEDVSQYDYVREWPRELPHRTGRPAWRGIEGRLVGYAELRADAPRGPYGFLRRCFFLKEYDRDRAPDDIYHARRPGDACAGGCPMEGVDPRTIAVGVPGRQTARAWGGPRPAWGCS